jgi:hypothetical protein
LDRRYLGTETLIGQGRYLGTEALIGQEVPWYRDSNWAKGTLVNRLLLGRGRGSLGGMYLGAESLNGQEDLGAESLNGQEVAWCRVSKWSGGTLVQSL